MHTAQTRQEIVDRVLDRSGRQHCFDRFELKEAALVVIDMQPTFVAPRSPAEMRASRRIITYIQWRADVLRPRGALICWVTHANLQTAGVSGWDESFDYFVADDVRAKTLASLKPESPGTLLWHEPATWPGRRNPLEDPIRRAD